MVGLYSFAQPPLRNKSFHYSQKQRTFRWDYSFFNHVHQVLLPVSKGMAFCLARHHDQNLKRKLTFLWMGCNSWLVPWSHHLQGWFYMMPTWAAVQEMLALPTNPSLVNGPIEMGFGVQGTSFRVGFLRYGNYWRFNCNWMVGSNVCKHTHVVRTWGYAPKIFNMETDDLKRMLV